MSSPVGNGHLKRWATIGTLAAAGVVVAGFTWDRVVGVVKGAENLAWLEKHRAEVPGIVRDNEAFRDETRRFMDAAMKRDEQTAAELKQIRDLLAQSIGTGEANQDLLYQVLALKHEEMGLPAPKKKRVFITPIPRAQPETP